MPFTEFCCRSGGSNLNAGTRTGSSTEPGTTADLTYASGSWVASTGVFTVASGNPSSDGVAVGDFASVYANGSTVTGFVGRVTARDTTTITVSLTAKAGTAPTDGTGNRTLKIGGAWQGPNGASGFPFSLTTIGALTNTAGDAPRFNLKDDQTYSVTAAVTSASAGPYVVQGYTTSYGDLGRFVLQRSSNNFTLLALLGNYITLADAIIDQNSGTGAVCNVATPLQTSFYRCVFRNTSGSGMVLNSYGSYMEECEFHTISGVNGALQLNNVATIVRCFFHDCSGRPGLYTTNVAPASAGSTIIDCVFDSCGADGVVADVRGLIFLNCDFYNNTGDGIDCSGSAIAPIRIQNCNFVKNGGYGIRMPASGQVTGRVTNCGFGSGTQANTSGQTTGGQAIDVSGSVTYASDVTPWVDPANGDFRINLAAAKGAGRGAYTQTAASYSGTVGYPDIGAAQHQDSGSSGARMVNIRGGADQ